MKFYTKYIDLFDVLIIVFDDEQVTNRETKDDMVLFYKDNRLIGANIFKPQISKMSNQLEDKQLQNFVINKLKNFIDFDVIDDQFIIVKVVECQKIENTHLSVCQVTDNKSILQVVCGANNVKKNMLTCLAKVGAFLPNGQKISKGSLKGFDSFGMLCSAQELKINNKNYLSSGIMDLKVAEKNIGKSIWEVL